MRKSHIQSDLSHLNLCISAYFSIFSGLDFGMQEINLTNLSDEIVLPMTNSAGFYRLATQ